MLRRLNKKTEVNKTTSLIIVFFAIPMQSTNGKETTAQKQRLCHTRMRGILRDHMGYGIGEHGMGRVLLLSTTAAPHTVYHTQYAASDACYEGSAQVQWSHVLITIARPFPYGTMRRGIRGRTLRHSTIGFRLINCHLRTHRRSTSQPTLISIKQRSLLQRQTFRRGIQRLRIHPERIPCLGHLIQRKSRKSRLFEDLFVSE
mmetsp:Transcript_40660/g.85419  ORF Transcript_40660/g.85419 Transcript_40660/m.85419 type:complete len:202 (-) Transcript_40660:1296-1901(-)